MGQRGVRLQAEPGEDVSRVVVGRWRGLQGGREREGSWGRREQSRRGWANKSAKLIHNIITRDSYVTDK